MEFLLADRLGKPASMWLALVASVTALLVLAVPATGCARSLWMTRRRQDDEPAGATTGQ